MVIVIYEEPIIVKVYNYMNREQVARHKGNTSGELLMYSWVSHKGVSLDQLSLFSFFFI